MRYYTLDKIRNKCPDAKYYVVFSLRSNGKSYSVLNLILENYFAGKGRGAIIRRWDTDYKSGRGNQMFEGLVSNGVITKLSHGEWSGVRYYAGKFYLTRKDEDGKITQDEYPFCYGFSLTATEHDKSTSYSDVTTILFDEFISRSAYLPDEFILLMNTISTIVRNRDNVTIYMMGNTINPYNPYFDEMGLSHAKKQPKGTIDVYTYGDSGLKVAVEFADKPNKSVPSNVYFAFDNPKLKMITSGDWEIAVYPHCPVDFNPADIKFIFFIKFEEDLLQCEIVMTGKYNFLYIHRKTTELRHPEKDLIFDTEYNPAYNWGRRITAPANNLQKKIAWYFAADKVFFQDNTVGEIVRNFIMWSDQAGNI